MAKCGNCRSNQICGCTIIDSASVDVQGNGSISSPFIPFLVAYPNPRPYANMTGEPFIPATSERILTASNADQSVPGMWNGSTRLIAPTTGTYLINLNMNSDVTTALCSKIRVNGLTVIASRFNYFTTTTPTGYTAFGTLTAIYRLNQNDYIEALSWNAVGGASVKTIFFLEMRWMGL